MSDGSKSQSIIEEKIGNTEVGFSEIMKLYEERILREGKDELFTKDDKINLDSNEKSKFRIEEGFFSDLFYNDEIVYFPITVTFKKCSGDKTYKIFTKKYFDIIYKEMEFKNPLLLIGNIYKNFDKDKTSLFYHFERNKIFVITEKQVGDYEKYYTNKIRPSKKYKFSELTPNFKHYFFSPKSDCEMNFALSTTRKTVIFSIFHFNEEKIHSIYGPFGNGKTTSLILIAKSKDNICYLNLDALYKNKNNLNLWKYDLFLLELFNLFKQRKKEFELITEKILGSNHFWEAISLSIEFCIENQIDAIFILDQYKEDIDPNFEKFKDLKEIINKDSNIFVKLVISSSINNKDIRDFIISKYISKKSPKSLINDYTYIPILFQLTDIKGLTDKLTPTKKKIFEEYFSNIPAFFYIIYEADENEIYQAFANIKKIIKDDIINFFKKNLLSQESFAFIIKNYPKIEIHSEKDNKINLKTETIKQFIKILPVKYFFLEIKEEEIVNISFYFKLAKICFMEVIIKILFELLETPTPNITERAIGDLLESIVIENLKDNSIEKFDQICKVDSIWDMNSVDELDEKTVNNKNILIIQDKETAKFVDFGLLLKGETLILFQCKKTLIEKPKEYVKIKDIFFRKNKLYTSFQKYFNCEIKKIKLIYLTGIYIIDDKEQKYHSWSGGEHSFDVLENITNEEQIPLAFFDVQNKKILIKKNESNFDFCSLTSIDSSLYNEDKYRFVEVKTDKSQLFEIFEGIKSQVEIQGINLIENSIIEEKSENKTDIDIYEQYLNRNIISNKRVVVNQPDASFLINNNENILTTFKINRKKYFSYYDNDKKKMQYKLIKDGKVQDIEMKDLNIYFLNKKTLKKHNNQ